jgi:hypothetical protein
MYKFEIGILLEILVNNRSILVILVIFSHDLRCENF